MDREERREHKARLVAVMLEGRKWHQAADSADIRTSRTAAYRLLRLVRSEKVTPPVREWLIGRCRGTPNLPGRVLRNEIEERFGVGISITHINRVRAELGVRNTSRVRGGKPTATG